MKTSSSTHCSCLLQQVEEHYPEKGRREGEHNKPTDSVMMGVEQKEQKQKGRNSMIAFLHGLQDSG
jgi:hypothetical protein